MNKQFKTAVIYARYSSDNQSEQSIEGQLRICEQYAKFNDILILDTYIDRAMTGTNDNRPDFQRMLIDSEKKQWDYVLVYKFDRFSRDKFQTVTHKKKLKDNGVKVISAMENIPDSPEGIILESLLEAMSQYYSMELSQKVKRGMNESRLKGNFTGGTLIYGYKVENKKVLIDEEQAEVVRFIYNQYSVGVFVKDIIADLTARGILNRSKPFARNTVYKILKNEKYSGIYRYNNEVFTNIYPQIVPTDTFNIVRRKIDSNRYGKRSTETVYLLKNKVKCGYCGSSITGEGGTSHTGNVKRYYKCVGRKLGNGCHKSLTRKEYIETLVVDTIVTQLKNPKTKESIIKAVLQIQAQNKENNVALNLLLKEYRQTETALKNIMSAVEQGIINKTTNSRMKELELKQDDLEKKIVIEKSKVAALLTENDIREFYEDALKLNQTVLINYLIKEILLFNNKIEIAFNTPLLKSPDESRGLCIYSEFGYILCTKNNNKSGLSNKKIQIEIYVK